MMRTIESLDVKDDTDTVISSWIGENCNFCDYEQGFCRAVVGPNGNEGLDGAESNCETLVKSGDCPLCNGRVIVHAKHRKAGV